MTNLHQVQGEFNAHQKNWLVDFFGRMFFPRQASWQQRNSVMLFFGAISAGILSGGGVLALMLLRASH